MRYFEGCCCQSHDKLFGGQYFVSTDMYGITSIDFNESLTDIVISFLILGKVDVPKEFL